MVGDEFYRSIVENSPMGYLYNKIIYDKNGNPEDYEIVTTNKTFQSMIGLEEEDLIGKNISDLYEELIKDKSNWDDFYSSIVPRFENREFEYYFSLSNSHYRIKSDNSTKDYTIVYFTDISTEVREREKINMLSDSMPIQVWYLNDQNTYGSANSTHADFIGIKKEDLYSKDINTLFSKEEAKICIEGNEKVFKGKKQIVIKSWLYNSLGENRLLRITKTPRFNPKGEVEFVICSAEDITEEYISKDQNIIKEKILYSTIEFTQELLTNKDHYKALSNGIEILGNATNVDRVYYWENHYDKDSKKWLTSQKFEWCLGSVDQQIDNPALQNIPFEDVGDFIETLSKNKSFNSHIKDMDSSINSTKQILEDQGILSILVLPVFIKDEFKGFIGFDSCKIEKEWSYVEISLLNAFVLLYVKSIERSSLENDILRVNENFENFFNMIHDQLYVLDFQGTIVDVNKSVLNKTDYTKEELIGNPVLMLHPRDKAEEVQANVSSLIMKEIEYCNIPAMKKNGEIFPVETRVSEGLWNEEKVIFVISKDISQLTMSEEKFSKAFNNSGISMIITRFEDGKILEANDTFLNFFGYIKEQIIGKTTLDLNLISEYENREKLKKDIKNNKKILNLEIEFLNKHNLIYKGLANIVPITINNELCLLSSVIDMTFRLEYEKKLLDLSNRDSLTGIYNRRFVYDRLETIIEECKRDKNSFSLAIIDIDDFKLVNDKYGHQVGDNVLMDFTKFIQEELRPYDILGRYGGEEFIIILNHSGMDNSLLILNRISNVIKNKSFIYKENSIKITFSCGVAFCKEFKKEEMGLDKLIEIADKRMYVAKNSGKNKIIFK